MMECKRWVDSFTQSIGGQGDQFGRISTNNKGKLLSFASLIKKSILSTNLPITNGWKGGLASSDNIRGSFSNLNKSFRLPVLGQKKLPKDPNALSELNREKYERKR